MNKSKYFIDPLWQVAGVSTGLCFIVLCLLLGRPLFIKTGEILHGWAIEPAIAVAGLVVVYLMAGYYAAAVAGRRELSTGISLAFVALLLIVFRDGLPSDFTLISWWRALGNLMVPAIAISSGAKLRTLVHPGK